MGRVLAIAVALFAANASAHTFAPQRSATLQLDDQGLAVLWRVEAGGNQAALLRASFDRDHDGRLSADESKRLAARMVTKAMRGMSLSWDGEPLAWRSLDVRLENGPDGKFIALGLGSIETPSPRGAHEVEVVLASGPSLSVGAQGLGWRISRTSRGKLAKDRAGLLRPVILAASDRLTLAVEAQ